MQIAAMDREVPFDDDNILKAMKNVTDWFSLGVHLKIEQPVLKKINADYGRDGTERCKLEMIAYWKRQDPTANWPKLRHALRSRNYDFPTPRVPLAEDNDTYYYFAPLPDLPVEGDNNYIPCCGKHRNPFLYFCNDPSCSKLLCYQCLATGSHRDHDWMELEQAFMSMETRLEQAGHATQEAASIAQHQMKALSTEEDRLKSKCETAKASIRTSIGNIQHQFEERKAYFDSNLQHAAQRHNFLKHRRPQENLKNSWGKLEELFAEGESVLVRLGKNDPMSLGEVEKMKERLKNIQDTVQQFQSQGSLPMSQFDADSEKVRAKLINFGEVKVDTFDQDPYSSSFEPYECRPKMRQRSLSDLPQMHTLTLSSSFKTYSKMQHPFPSDYNKPIAGRKPLGSPRLATPQQQASYSTYKRRSLPNQLQKINSFPPEKTFTEQDHFLPIPSSQEEDIYDEPYSILPAHCLSPPLPPSQAELPPPPPPPLPPTK